jgi:hypothetical protein
MNCFIAIFCFAFVSVHSRLLIPRQEFINPVDPVVCDAAEDACEL